MNKAVLKSKTVLKIAVMASRSRFAESAEPRFENTAMLIT
jgi:hypothetical protein